MPAVWAAKAAGCTQVYAPAAAEAHMNSRRENCGDMIDLKSHHELKTLKDSMPTPAHSV
jgi:hypothetical protein